MRKSHKTKLIGSFFIKKKNESKKCKYRKTPIKKIGKRVANASQTSKISICF